MDGWSISAAEGFRLAGFNGSPKIFDSVEPLIDILVTTSNDNDVGGVGMVVLVGYGPDYIPGFNQGTS
jgi:hypothetical protein